MHVQLHAGKNPRRKSYLKSLAEEAEGQGTKTGRTHFLYGVMSIAGTVPARICACAFMNAACDGDAGPA